MTIKVSMKVNGKPVAAEVEARTLLVTYIRENLRLTGTHVGCDTAQCGACTVLMNGRAIKSLLDRRHAGRRRRHHDHRGRGQARRHAAPDAGGVQGEPRPAVRLLHARHGDERARFREEPSRTRPTRKCARRSTATCAAAPATTTSSRASSPARKPWEANCECPRSSFPDRRARPAQGGLPLPHRRRPVHRRRRAAEPGLRGVRALAARARGDQEDRLRKGEEGARRDRHLHRRRPRRRQGRRPALRLADHRRQRPADEGAAASLPRAGQGAPRRRPRRGGDRRDARPGARRRRAGRGRLRGAARGHRCGEGAHGRSRSTTSRPTTPATSGRSATRPQSMRRSRKRAT